MFSVVTRATFLSIFVKNVDSFVPLSQHQFSPLGTQFSSLSSSARTSTSKTKISSTKLDNEDKFLNNRSIYNEITSLNVPIGEAGRITRRDVYTEADWVKARSSTRMFYMLGNTFKSAIVGQLFNEVSFIATIGLFVVAWNSLLIEGYTDFSGIHHDALYQLPSFFLLKLPVLPFQLSSSALGLLLGRYCCFEK
jgi:hypothetical protein